MFCVGIDIAKRSHEASIIDSEGKPLLDSISLTNSREGCEKLFLMLEKYNIAKSDAIIGMEATGHYWLAIYEHLTEQSYDGRVINPIQSEACRKCTYAKPKMILRILLSLLKLCGLSSIQKQLYPTKIS